MSKKYYQIRENVDSSASVGVICIENGVVPTDQITTAISEHLDELIKVIAVNFLNYEQDLEIIIERYPENEEMIKDIFNAEQTWLYFKIS